MGSIAFLQVGLQFLEHRFKDRVHKINPCTVELHGSTPARTLRMAPHVRGKLLLPMDVNHFHYFTRLAGYFDALLGMAQEIGSLSPLNSDNIHKA